MQYDIDKVDDAVLVLLILTVHQEDEYGARAWKGHDWDALNRLYEKDWWAILFPRRNQWFSRPKV